MHANQSNTALPLAYCGTRSRKLDLSQNLLVSRKREVHDRAE